MVNPNVRMVRHKGMAQFNLGEKKERIATRNKNSSFVVKRGGLVNRDEGTKLGAKLNDVKRLGEVSKIGD
jgi:hypothetical protein